MNTCKLAVPKPLNEFDKRSISYRRSVLWNSLLLELWQLTSPNVFKGILRDLNIAKYLN